jgi:hypothetical protein
MSGGSINSFSLVCALVTPGYALLNLRQRESIMLFMGSWFHGFKSSAVQIFSGSENMY